MTPYERPALDAGELDTVRRVAHAITFQMSRPQKARMIAAIIAENVQLLKECNAHRTARGFDPLPVYKPQGL